MALADQIAAYEVPWPTIAGGAGLSKIEVEAEREHIRLQLLALATAIRGTGRGRPRKNSSVYLLPRAAVLQFRATVPTFFISPSLQSIAKRMVGQAKPKRLGRRSLVGAALKRRTAASLDERHLRRLAARLRAEREHESCSASLQVAEAEQDAKLREELEQSLRNPVVRAILAGMHRF